MQQPDPEKTKALLRKELKRSLFKALTFKTDGVPSASQKSIVAALTVIAQSLEFELFSSEDQMMNTITFCGSIFVVDIDLGAVDGPTVTLTASEAEIIPPQTNDYLTNLLRNHEFEKLEESLRFVKLVDKTKNEGGFDFMKSLSQIMQDLLFIHDIESANNSIIDIIVNGTGLPLIFERSFGPSLIFYAEKELMNRIDFSHSLLNETNSFTVTLSIEEYSPTSLVPTHFARTCFSHKEPVNLIGADAQSCCIAEMAILNANIGIVKPKPDSKLKSNGAISLTFSPTVYVAEVVYERLTTLAVHRDPHLNEDAIKESNETGELYEVRVKQFQSETFMVSLATKTRLVPVEKLMLSDLCHLHQILNIMRQSIRFHELIKDFAQTCKIKDVLFHLVDWKPPSEFTLFFVHRKPPFRFQARFSLSEQLELEVGLFKCEPDWVQIPLDLNCVNPVETMGFIIDHL